MYYPEYLKAWERNRTAAYQRERFRRRTIAERTFASLDRLGWDRSRRRGLGKVDCERYMVVLGLIDNWTKLGCGGRAETEYQEVQ